MHHVLVCGGGVDGLAAAHRLRRLLPESDRIMLFDASPVHTFWPSLLWVMTGARGATGTSRRSPLNAIGGRSGGSAAQPAQLCSGRTFIKIGQNGRRSEFSKGVDDGNDDGNRSMERRGGRLARPVPADVLHA